MTTKGSRNNWREKPNDYWDGEDYRDTDYLEHKYWDEGLTMKEIADEQDVSIGTIKKWLEKTGLGTRGLNERRKNHVELSGRLVRMLEGESLGDGYLGKSNETGGSYLQEQDKNKSYVEWLQSELEKLGVDGSVGKSHNEKGTQYYRYSSSKIMEFNEIREKWYGDGGLSIPHDFSISPTAMLLWYIGDGTFSESHGEPVVKIASYKFGEGLDSIVDQLGDLGIQASRYEQGLRIWLKSQDDWFDYLNKSHLDIPEAYEYKFP